MEELANAATHGIGLALSLLGAVLLIVAAAWSRDAWVIVSCCVYATTLVSLYAESTTMHSVPHPRSFHYSGQAPFRSSWLASSFTCAYASTSSFLGQ